MSESKHTPGPWEASHNGVHKRISKGYAQCVAIAHDPNEPGQVTDVTLANARLIAAAPDLLEALRAITDAAIEATSEDGDVSDIDGSLIDAARAAIAKATGEKP